MTNAKWEPESDSNAVHVVYPKAVFHLHQSHVSIQISFHKNTGDKELGPTLKTSLNHHPLKTLSSNTLTC